MADDENKLTNGVNNLQMNGDCANGNSQDCEEPIDEAWGLTKSEVYKNALRFYKEKEGKAMHLSYKDKLKLVALTKQVSNGKYSPGVTPAVGFLDVVGNDRIKVWQSLGDMSKSKALDDFVQLLDSLCPAFKPYVEAQKREKEEQERKRKEEIERQRKEEEEAERLRLEEDARERQRQQQQKQLNQELQIRAALNQQTTVQFKQYAEQHCPGNLQQQEELIKQLQEQHFQQYMQQVYQQQLLHQQQQYNQLQNMNQGGTPSQKQQTVSTPHTGSNGMPLNPSTNNTTTTALSVSGGIIGPQGVVLPNTDTTSTNNHILNTNYQYHQPHRGENGEDGGDSENNGYLPIAAPSMWTRKDIKEFKDSLRKDTDSIIKVGSGETVTVRVPTHEDGTCLFWEFATDSYDLGFGVYFEWTAAQSNQVSVHVSESSDEDDLEDEEGGGETPNSKDDVEKGGDATAAASKKDDNRPPTDEIIPVYRRDCHEEVYCGSHMYPGRGVYLLKFDNSYSLWRSKTLYYRVYYTR